MNTKRKYSFKFSIISKLSICFILFSLFFFNTGYSQANIEVSGIIVDETNYPVPYVAVGIVKKHIGTASTDDGEFSFLISKAELQDTLSISSLGYDPFKIKVEDYLAQKEKKVILKESVVEMDEIRLLKPVDYVLNAYKKIKENYVSTPHQIDILYRRACTEGGKSKFFVENFIKVKDRGPSYNLGTVEVAEARKSADYRIWKRKQWTHSINHMASGNPLRPSEKRPNIKKFTWKKTGDTSYEGEDVVIIEGIDKKSKWNKIKFYIGLDTYSVFKIERGKALYLFKKHSSGKLYLSYYAHEWGFGRDMIPKQYWNTDAEKMSYRLEAFVQNIETNKKKIKVRAQGGETDMGSQDLPYNPNFWKSLSMPPDTKFFKKIKSELESNYGVPLEKQFEIVNK